MNISCVKNDCVGCTSCQHICPVHAISMKRDDKGFLYPSIDLKICTDCGKCICHCPVYMPGEMTDNRISAFYGQHNNPDIVMGSSSGGAFTKLAEQVIHQDGVVYGALFDASDKRVKYSGTKDISLDALRKSKYVASELDSVFSDIKTNLSKGIKVLFCGLPCHSAGLRKYLGYDDDNLIICDFICGGVASPKCFQDYCMILESKYGSQISNVDFRAKVKGWKEHSIKVAFQNGKTYSSSAMHDRFFRGYFEKPYQRDCCYHCKYRLHHVSDIIIADYWGAIAQRIEHNNLGLSMVISNSEKGDRYIKEVFDKGSGFEEMPVQMSDYAFKQETERYEKAKQVSAFFWDLYRKKGYVSASNRCYYIKARKEKIKTRICALRDKMLGK